MVSALLRGLFSRLVPHCQRSKHSAALFCRSATFCCRLGTNRPDASGRYTRC